MSNPRLSHKTMSEIKSSALGIIQKSVSGKKVSDLIDELVIEYESRDTVLKSIRMLLDSNEIELGDDGSLISTSSRG